MGLRSAPPTMVTWHAAAALTFALGVPATADEDAAPPPVTSVIVCVRDVQDGSVPSRASLRPMPSAPLAARIESLGGRVARGLLDGLPAERFASVGARRDDDPFQLDPERVWLIETADSAAARLLADALAQDPAVEWAEPNVLREAMLAPAWSRAGGLPPDDPLLRDGRQWGLDNRGAGSAYGGVAGADIRALEAWSMSCGSSAIRLAIADTGIDPNHPDLQQALPDGLRVEHGLNVTNEPSRSWADSLGHGTFVVGVMAALTGDGAHFDSLGVAGVCGGNGAGNPGCRILAIKVSPGRSRYATSFDIARAILHAAASRARAVNVSFAGSGPSRLERLALHHAMEHGCLVVAASGNRGATTPRAPQYPAAYATDGLCLQVGASDPSDRRAAFSSYGPGLDLLAPGLNVWTTSITYPATDGVLYAPYLPVSGTSLAAPFATGGAGLLAAARPELAADDLRQFLRIGARDIGSPGPDEETGMGVLDAAAALRLVPPEVGIWHDEVAADTWSEAGVDTLRVGEPGPGTLTGPRTWPGATRIEFRATVTLPDSFADSVRVWPRVAGTTAVRGGFRLPYYAPWAEVASRTSRSFTLRGFGYRVPGAGGERLDVPLPADQVRFGFTVLGRVRRARPDAHPPNASLAVKPNPFRNRLRIERPPRAEVSVHDLMGRRVRVWPADDSVGVLDWDGRDADGLACAPGLYWVRSRGPTGTSLARVIKLE